MPILPASRGPVTPMTNPTTPCGAMIRPVNSGDSCRTCCRYSESTSISPPFHRPSRKASVVPSRSPRRCSRAGRISGSGCRDSALANPAVATTATTAAAMTSGEVQPSTTPWDTANTSRVTALVIRSAPRTSSRARGPGRAGLGRAEHGRGQGGGDQADRDVDQEHRAPAGELHQHPAQDLAGDEPDGGDRAVQADGPGTFGAFGEAGGDEGQRGRGDDRGARALHDPRRDQQHRVLRQPAGQAGQGERDQARDEHAPPAEQVGGPAAENEKAAERDGVSRHDPLDCVGGHVQFPLDRGQRDVHDAEIEDDHERSDENQGQLQRLAAGRERVLLARALFLSRALLSLLGVVFAAGRDSRRPEGGTVTGMTPIRYVTDRFGFLHDRTGP